MIMLKFFALAVVFYGNVHAWSLTVQEFQKCAAAFNHGTPSASIAEAFIAQAEEHGNITSKREAFMAISEMSWESVGFTARSEYACSGGHWSKFPCDTYDTKGCPKGKYYYGRGFLQLTGCYLYREASKEFPGIVEDPDSVANNDTLAMGTALWTWKTHVHNSAGVEQGHFGAATKSIDGYYECTPGNYTLLSRERWNRFNACLKAVNYADPDIKETGCYEGSVTLTTPVDVDHTAGHCRSRYPELPQYNQWCGDDCPHGNCPDTICTCGQSDD